MPNDLHGLPLHPLIVHATVVIVPLAALNVLLSALSPRFRSWAGPLPMALSLMALVLVPLSTSTGETLERHVPHSALVERHTHLADGLLPWVIGLFAVALLGYGAHRLGAGAKHAAVPVMLALLATITVVGTTVQVVRIGESGAKAAWSSTDMTH